MLNTDSAVYRGGNVGNEGQTVAQPIEANGRPFSLALTLPPLATLVLAPTAPGRDAGGAE